jgi:hypothetical protein
MHALIWVVLRLALHLFYKNEGSQTKPEQPSFISPPSIDAFSTRPKCVTPFMFNPFACCPHGSTPVMNFTEALRQYLPCEPNGQLQKPKVQLLLVVLLYHHLHSPLPYLRQQWHQPLLNHLWLIVFSSFVTTTLIDRPVL